MKTNTPNSSKQQIITYLAAEGKSVKEIAENTGMSQSTVKGILSDERVAFDIKHLRFKLHGKGVKERFNDMLPKAQDVAAEILENPNTKSQLKFQVAQEVFDRALGRPKQTIEHEGSMLRTIFEKLDGQRSVSVIDGELVTDVEVPALEPIKEKQLENPNNNPMDDWMNKNM